MATQSKLSSSLHRVRKFLVARGIPQDRAALVLALVLILLRRQISEPFLRLLRRADSRTGGRKELASPQTASSSSNPPPLARAEQEELYIMHADNSRELLVPHRGKVSKVLIKPVKLSTYEAHRKHFSRAPPLSSSGIAGRKAAAAAAGKSAKEVEEQGRLQSAKEIREAGSQAAATAKRVGVNKEFFRQLRAIFRILIPRTNTKEVFIFILHTAFLILRTYLSVLVARLDGAIVRDLVSANAKGFVRGLVYWYLLALPSTYTNSMIRYLQSKLAIGFRTRLTRYVHDLYLSPSKNFYKIINLDGRLDAADQFITTDVARFCDTLAALYSNISKPTLDLIIFNYQLGRSLGKWGVIGLFLNYLVTGRILRSVTPAFGKLAAIEAKLEGDFRNAHSRLITNSEEIAFYNGALLEKDILNRAYRKLIRHINSIFKIRIAYSMTEDFVLKYAWSAAGYIIIALPVLTGRKAPKRTPSISDAGQAASNKRSEVANRTESYISNRRLLISLADAGARLMASYKDLAELAGYTSRVYTLISTLHALNHDEFQTLPRPSDLPADQPFYDLGNIHGVFDVAADGDKGGMAFENVPIVAPAPGMERGGEELVKSLDVSVQPGEHMLITGPNGVGKTAIARVVAGLWPVWKGELKRPSYKEIMFLPQRPYLAIGSLRDQVVYPHSYTEFKGSGKTDADLLKILEKVHLAYLPEREGGWETKKEWKDVLSGGEKQRMGMARLFYHCPRFGVLDECTSAVSTDVEGLMYTHAKELGISLITISHRPSLFKYHTHLLRLTGEKGGWEMSTIGGAQERMTLDQEIADLETKLAEVKGWKARVAEIQQELNFSKT